MELLGLLAVFGVLLEVWLFVEVFRATGHLIGWIIFVTGGLTIGGICAAVFGEEDAESTVATGVISGLAWPFALVFLLGFGTYKAARQLTKRGHP